MGKGRQVDGTEICLEALEGHAFFEKNISHRFAEDDVKDTSRRQGLHEGAILILYFGGGPWTTWTRSLGRSHLA